MLGDLIKFEGGEGVGGVRFFLWSDGIGGGFKGKKVYMGAGC